MVYLLPYYLPVTDLSIELSNYFFLFQSCYSIYLFIYIIPFYAIICYFFGLQYLCIIESIPFTNEPLGIDVTGRNRSIGSLWIYSIHCSIVALIIIDYLVLSSSSSLFLSYPEFFLCEFP